MSDSRLQLRAWYLAPAAAQGAQLARPRLSREAAFLVNNWGSCCSPRCSCCSGRCSRVERGGDRQPSHARDRFFTSGLTPVGLILLMLNGVGPLLGGGARRSRTRAAVCGRGSRVSRRLAAVATLYFKIRSGRRSVLRAVRFRDRDDRAGFWKGAATAAAKRPTDLFHALVGLVRKNSAATAAHRTNRHHPDLLRASPATPASWTSRLPAEAGPGNEDRQYTIQEHGVKLIRRRPEADDDGVSDGPGRRQGDRRLYPGEGAYRSHENERTRPSRDSPTPAERPVRPYRRPSIWRTSR